MAGFQAVLFDFDGVLSRTHEDNYAAWIHAFSSCCLAPPDEEEYALMEGLRSSEMVPHFLKKYGADEGLVSVIIDRKKEHYAKNAKLSLYPGAAELVGVLHAASIKIAVVSGGSAARLRSPECLELLGAFDVIITGDDCHETKPSPRPYLHAAETLDVRPDECLVIENAPLGIESARRAGMRCVAITTTLGISHLAGADVVLESMHALLSRLVVEKNGSGSVLLLKDNVAGRS